MRIACTAHVDLIARKIVQEQATHDEIWIGAKLFTVERIYIQELYNILYREGASLRKETKGGFCWLLCVTSRNFFGFDFVVSACS